MRNILACLDVWPIFEWGLQVFEGQGLETSTWMDQDDPVSRRQGGADQVGGTSYPDVFHVVVQAAKRFMSPY
jgi:hypothetical protein